MNLSKFSPFVISLSLLGTISCKGLQNSLKEDSKQDRTRNKSSKVDYKVYDLADAVHPVSSGKISEKSQEKVIIVVQ